MAFAVISDIHANWEALQVVLADIKKQGIAEIYCTGDIIGYGPDPSSCASKVIKHCKGRATKGNHEFVAQRIDEGKKEESTNEDAEETIKFSNKKLWKNQKRALFSLPVEIQNEHGLFVHGNPAPDLPKKADPELIAAAKVNSYLFWKDDYVGRIAAETSKGGLRQMPLQPYDEATINLVFRAMREKGITACFTGHLHVAGCITDPLKKDCPHIPELMLASRPLLHKTPQKKETFTLKKEPGKLYLILCGAVGQPRDRDNRACYAIVDEDSINWRRLPYAYQTTINSMKKNGLPEKQAERLRYGKYPNNGLDYLLSRLPE